jgi:hypothetical protein
MAGRTGHLARPEGLLNWQQRAALWTDSLVEDHLQEIDAALRTSVGDVLPAEIPVSLDSVALDDTSLDKSSALTGFLEAGTPRSCRWLRSRVSGGLHRRLVCEGRDPQLPS